MAYFLKKTKNKKGLYLQIYESFYDPERGHTAHKSYKPIGYVHELQAKGIDDPISHFKEEVNQLNQDFQTTKNAKKALQISDESPEKLIGCEYEKIIEIYNHQIHQLYHFDTSHTYFDCTNFYFEIDKEDDFRKKGPSNCSRSDTSFG